MVRQSRGRLYCFSPPVMLATFIIETFSFIYVFVRYKLTTFTRLATATLGLLAIFQLAEYNVCGGHGVSAATWSRIGFMAITLLPPLGIHLIQTISGRNIRWVVGLSYLSGLTFAGLFGLSQSSFNSHICAGNYAIFQLANNLGGAYFAYYYTLLFLGISLGLYFSLSAKQRVREGLILQVFGYLCFLLPTGVTNAVNPQTISGIPSIMCGYAVIYALILTLGIVPGLASTKKT
ncbi:MAG TPA: hypothetical protein VLF39_04175 [Candidatus Saccharimonadales bacterium]|nr:hypothetical protein [Candidatus Saccharimonadales bacterium]